MKVLHVIPSISPRRGGPGVAALEMAAALRQQGVEASLLTTNDDGPGLLVDLPLGRWIDHDGVPLLAFGRWSPPITPLREFAVAPALSQWLAAHLADYDLLHQRHGPGPPGGGSLRDQHDRPALPLESGP